MEGQGGVLAELSLPLQINLVNFFFNLNNV